MKIVGILNVTPDSFSDGGLYLDPESAVKKARELCNDGADIVDIGGQATGPGSSSVGAHVEVSRIGPVLKRICSSISVSVDTYRADVARFAIDQGAAYINDVSAGSDSEMFPIVADSDSKIILMHSAQKRPHDFSFLDDPDLYKGRDIIAVISDFFEERVARALRSGVRKEQIILDPGMGAFIGRNPATSWEIINRFNEFRQFGFALMFATSRKGFLKQAGEISPVERDPLSALTGFIAAQGSSFTGPDYIRVHNPKLQRTFLNVVKETS